VCIADRAGADELESVNMLLSFSGGWSVVLDGLNWRGGNEGALPPACELLDECEGCRCSPSIWSGSGEGIRARGPSSDGCPGCELYEFERIRLKVGFAKASPLYSSCE
jgi:hypothetical protein